MEIKSNVRQRRLAKIKEIRERGAPAGFGTYPGHGWEPNRPPAESAAPSIRTFERDEPFPAVPLAADPRFQDPEYVWKHRHRLDHASGGGGSGGGTAGPPAFHPRRTLPGRIILCGVLLGLVWGMFQLNTPWAERGQAWVTRALTEDFRFDQAAAWYEEHFQGAPSFIPTFGGKKATESARKAAAPVSSAYTPPARGKIVSAFRPQSGGIVLETKAGTAVQAIETGHVIFAGNQEGSGLTVMIQHAGQVVSVYGNLSEILVRKNDWVEGGEPVGKVSTDAASSAGRFYFAVRKDGQPVDPADVVGFD